MTTKEKFLEAVEPYRKGSVLYASAYTLMKVTGCKNRQQFNSLLYQNHLTIDNSQKWVRRNTSRETAAKINYIISRRQEKPPVSFQRIGEELGCSKQYVYQLLTRYGVEFAFQTNAEK